MYPHSNQPAKLYGTAQTHRFKNTKKIKNEQIKFPTRIDQKCVNKFTIEDIPKKIRDFPPLENEEEDVSYDVESLFTKIPLKETVNYILDQI